MRIALLLTFFIALSLGTQAQVSTVSLAIKLTDIQSVKVESKQPDAIVKSASGLMPASDLKILNPFASEVRKIGVAYSASAASRNPVLIAGNSKSVPARSPDLQTAIPASIPHFVYQINPR